VTLTITPSADGTSVSIAVTLEGVTYSGTISQEGSTPTPANITIQVAGLTYAGALAASKPTPS
jgi:hypothetical protein